MNKLFEALGAPFEKEECEQYEDGNVTLWRVKNQSLVKRWIDVTGSIPVLDVRSVEATHVETSMKCISVQGRLNHPILGLKSGDEFGSSVGKPFDHQLVKAARTNLFARCCACFGMNAPEKLLAEEPIKVKQGTVVGDGAKGIEEMKDTARKAIEGGTSLYKEEAPQEKLEHKEEKVEPKKELEGVADTIEKLGGETVIHRAKIEFDSEFYNAMLEKKAGTPQIKELFEFMGFSPELWADAKRVTLPKLLTVYRELYDVTESQASMKVQAFLEGEDMEGLPEPPEKEVPVEESEEEVAVEEEEVVEEEAPQGESTSDWDSDQAYEMDDERFEEMSLEDAIDFEWKYSSVDEDSKEKEEVSVIERIDCVQMLEDLKGVTKINYSDVAPQEILEKFPTLEDLTSNIHPGIVHNFPSA